MSEHLSAQVMGRYLKRELSPEELLRADDHLFACQACREGAATARQPDEILFRLHADLTADGRTADQEHIPYEQLAALVDNQLDLADREVAESHLELCRLCATEVDDLRVFRASLSHVPAEQKARAPLEPRFKQNLAAFRHFFGFPLPVRLAAALALLIFVSLTALLLWRQLLPAPEVVKTMPPPATNETPRPSPDVSPETTPNPAESGGPSTQIVLALADGGGEITLDAQGAMRGLEALSPEAQRAVKNALTSGRVEKSASLAGLNGKVGTLMGGPQDPSAEFSLISPIGTVVRADRPRLSWKPLPGASAYTVTVLTVLDSNLNIVATSPALSTTTWTPSRALERGRLYKWQVSTFKNGEAIISPAPPAPEARFRVLDSGAENELRRLERTNIRSRLARGVFYARAGLLDEAEREFRALATANPKSPVVQSLLQSVKRR